MKKFNQILAVAVSATVAMSSAPWPVYALESAGQPEFVQPLIPPSRLGYMDSFFKGTNARPVILIQDLHANFGVQKKIIGLLKFIQPTISSSNKMIIGMENAWKNYDLSYVRSKELPLRTKAMNVLLKEAVISGPEYFATLAPKDITLTGVDDAQDKQLSLELTRRSFQSRLTLSSKVDRIRTQIQTLKSMAPGSLKTLWHAEADYKSGKIGRDVLAHVLGKDILLSSDKQAEEQLLARKLELAEKEGGKNALMLKNLVVADQTFNVLSRLLRQQMTLEEVQFAAQHAEQFLNVIRAFLPGEDLTPWKEAMSTAVDYYSVALVRNKPLAENTAALVAQNPDTSIVLVVGGFHTAGIAKLLEQKNISYIILSPVVESHTSRDEMLYIRRILGEPLAQDEMIKDLEVSSNQSFDLQPTGLAVPVSSQLEGNVGNVIRSAETGELKRDQPENENPDSPQRKLQPVATPVRNLTHLLGPIISNLEYRDSIVSNVITAGQTYLLTGDQLIGMNIKMLLDTGGLKIYPTTEKRQSNEFKETSYYLVPSPMDPGLVTLRKVSEDIVHEVHISRNADDTTTIIDSIGNDHYSVDETVNETEGIPLTHRIIKAMSLALTEMGSGSLGDFLDKHGVVDLTFEVAPNNALEETFFDRLDNGQVRVRLSPSLITNKDPNAMFIAVGKALVNIETPDKDENVTLPRFWAIALRSIGREALQAAYETFSLGGQPFVLALKRIRSKMGNDIDDSSSGLQASWIEKSPTEMGSIVNELLGNPIVRRILFINVNGKEVMRKLMPVLMDDGSLWESPITDSTKAAAHESLVQKLVAEHQKLSGELAALLALDANHPEAERKRLEIEAAKRAINEAA
jgi:hypothetical protein